MEEFLKNGKELAPCEEKAWRDSQKEAFDMACIAVVQKELLGEATAARSASETEETRRAELTQIAKALEAQLKADQAGERERWHKAAYRLAVDSHYSSKKKNGP